jgi:predicted porin
MNNQRTGLLAATLLAVLAAPSARAIDVTAGKWTLSFDGNVNAFYIYSSCESKPVVVGGGLACVASSGSSSVSNGLLPAALAISGATTQNDIDIGFTFGLYPGISTNDGGSPNLQSIANPDYGHTALGTAGLDIRQVFLTAGNDTWGTVMAGRNIGFFQGDAILNDMTLLGVGGGNGNYAAPANTSLGSIGLGYIYTDWLSQIDYTTPSINGTKVSIGIFDPLNTLGQTPYNHNAPGIQAKVAYTMGPVYLSASGLEEKQRIPCSDTGAIPAAPCAGAATGDVEYHSWAFDVGGKYDYGPLEVLGWYYRGTGVGTTGLFILANDTAGNPRGSEGYLAQVTYKLGNLKLGVNYGTSDLDRTSLDPGTLLHKNDKYTFGAYENVTDNLLLVGEFTKIRSENQLGTENSSWNLNVGLFLKF